MRSTPSELPIEQPPSMPMNEVIFFAGAALALISLIVSQKVDPEGQLVREEADARIADTDGVVAPVLAEE